MRLNPRIAPVIQQNFKDIAPWVQPEIRQVETQALYDALKTKDYSIADTGWVADFNDAYNFLYLLDSRTGPMNYGDYTNPAYDALLDASAKELDTTKRAAILKQAEQLMLEDTAVLPMLTRVTQDIVSPKITGYADNAEVALPLLHDRGLPATVYVTSAAVGTTSAWMARAIRRA